MLVERDEISTIIQTETNQVLSEALDKKGSDIRQLVVTILTIISMAVGVVLWATSSHASIKEWTIEQNFVTKKELQDIIKEQYVKREDFVVVRENLKNLNEKHSQLLQAIDKIDKKLDRIENEEVRRSR